MTSTLCIIPARGGSKGIPRKNLRSLAGKPLIAHVINTTLSTEEIDRVVVSTDDEEIARTAERYGASTLMRPDDLAYDHVTIDPVVAHALECVESEEQEQFGIVVTVQPTSPLLSTTTLANALRRFADMGGNIDTMVSAREVRHLSWRQEAGAFRPNYTERRNRAEIPPEYHETGAFFICSAELLRETGQRFGQRVDIVVMPDEEAVDIDTAADWALAEALLSRQRIAIIVAGNSEIGLGHVYRGLSIASDLAAHAVEFFVPAHSQLAAERLSLHNYPVTVSDGEDLLDKLTEFGPDVIVNDTLDTSADYMPALKALSSRLVSLEDLGAGADMADVVINALYPERHVRANAYHGPDFVVLRDEFLFSEPKVAREQVTSVLITFGGTDPSDLTRTVLKAISETCRVRNIGVTVIFGPGYDGERVIEYGEHVQVLRDVRSMAEHMRAADIIFTSAGRTVYEIACLGTPTIVLAQNTRELSHFFASSENGFLNLGLGSDLTPEQINREFIDLCEDVNERQLMNQRMLAHDLKRGRRRVVELILGRTGVERI